MLPTLSLYVLSQVGASERVTVLLGLPAAQQLDQQTVLQLLQVAVEKKLSLSGRKLCDLPAARAVRAECSIWVALWNKAAAIQGPTMLCTLLQLPAACVVLSPSVLLPLLQAAVHCKDSHKLHALCQVQAAGRVDADSALQLLHTAVAGGSAAKVAALAQLQRLQELSVAACNR